MEENGEWICQREANNTNRDHDPLKGAIRETEIITGGFNIQNGISDTKHYPFPVQRIMEETEMIPVGWNSQREAGNTQQNLNPVKYALL